MKTKILLVGLLLLAMTLPMVAQTSPLIGKWIWIDGPRADDNPNSEGYQQLFKYDYVNDSICNLYFDSYNGGIKRDTIIMTCSYILDTEVIPHRNTWYYNGKKANLAIWSISGNILTEKASGGNTMTFPASFGVDSNYDWITSHYVKQATTGVNEIKSVGNLITIYPNPATNVIQITGIEGTATITVSDVNGRLLLSKQVKGNEVITISTLPNGVYLITIQSNNTRKTEKLVIQR